uniref:Uncharacterized protein n=1 Tax=Anguilla anguilla TaxID=7936 RepID=A0A0E9W7P4_ANGAN
MAVGLPLLMNTTECAYLGLMRNSFQVVGLKNTKHLRLISRSWFIHFIYPLDWGWKPEDKLTSS